MAIQNEYGFRHIVSLGYNCEVSFRIEEYTASKIESHFFSWTYVCDQGKMRYALENMENLLTGRYGGAGTLLNFRDSNISFHSRPEAVKKIFRPDGSLDIPEAELALAEMRPRYRHLAEKTRALMQSGESTLFVMKIQHFNQSIPVSEQVQNVQSVLDYLLEHFSGQQFLLLAVAERQNWNDAFASLQNEHLVVDRVEEFAPDYDTLNGGDIQGWMQLLSYYDHVFDHCLPSPDWRRAHALRYPSDCRKRTLEQLYALQDAQLGDEWN